MGLNCDFCEVYDRHDEDVQRVTQKNYKLPIILELGANLRVRPIKLIVSV